MKLLYILQESRMRELDSNIVLANSIINQGKFDGVVIADQNILDKLLTTPLLPKGVIHLKSIPYYIKKKLRRYVSRGHRLTCQNAESLVTFDTVDEYDGFMTSHQCAEMIDLIFCINVHELEALKNYFSKYSMDIPLIISGHPRMMMTRNECLKYYEKDIAENKLKYGKFIFYATSLGPSLDESLNTQEKLMNYYEVQGLNQSNMELMAKWMLYNREMLPKFCEFLQRLANDPILSEYTVIVRPHPSDNIEKLQDLIQPYSNVKIVYSGHVIPWLLASKLNLASTSTVLVESVSLNCPTLSYLPELKEEIYVYLKNHDINNYCEQAENTDQLISKIEKISKLENKIFHTKKNHSDAKQSVGREFNVRDIMSNKFLEIANKLDVKQNKIVLYLKKVYLIQILPSIFLIYKKIYLKYIEKKLGREKIEYMTHKNPPLENKDYSLLLDRVNSLKLNISLSRIGTLGVLVKKNS